PPQRIGERLLIRDPFYEIGDLIALLAASGSPEAIDALAAESARAPVDVRLAVVRLFLPGGKPSGGSSTGRSVSLGSLVALASPDDLKAVAGNSSPSAVDAAIVRLLRGALRDRAERTSMQIQ